MGTSQKICSKESALEKIKDWKQSGKVVFTNGCFDIVHLGHVDYLEKAKKLGYKLVVGLNTDQSVQRLKGKERPIVNQEARARVIAALAFVDAVILFDEDTPYDLIAYLMPDILVKGDDYNIQNIVGANLVLGNGGEVKTIKLVDGFSTSNLVNKIKSL